MVLLPLVKAASLIVNLIDTHKVLRLAKTRNDGGRRLRISPLRRDQIKQTLLIWVVWTFVNHFEILLDPILSPLHSLLPFPLSLLLPYPTILLSIHTYLLITRTIGSGFIFQYVLKPLIQVYERRIDLTIEFVAAVGALGWSCLMVLTSSLVDAGTRVRTLAGRILGLVADTAGECQAPQLLEPQGRISDPPNFDIGHDLFTSNRGPAITTPPKAHLSKANTPARTGMLDFSTTTTPQRLRQVQAQARDVLASFSALRSSVAKRSDIVRENRKEIGKRARERGGNMHVDSLARGKIGKHLAGSIHESKEKPSVAHATARPSVRGEGQASSNLGEVRRNRTWVDIGLDGTTQEQGATSSHNSAIVHAPGLTGESSGTHVKSFQLEASLATGRDKERPVRPGLLITSSQQHGQDENQHTSAHGIIAPLERVRSPALPSVSSEAGPAIYRLAPASSKSTMLHSNNHTSSPRSSALPTTRCGPKSELPQEAGPSGQIFQRGARAGHIPQPLLTPMLPGGFRFMRSDALLKAPSPRADLDRMGAPEELGTGEYEREGTCNMPSETIEDDTMAERDKEVAVLAGTGVRRELPYRLYAHQMASDNPAGPPAIETQDGITLDGNSLMARDPRQRMEEPSGCQLAGGSAAMAERISESRGIFVDGRSPRHEESVSISGGSTSGTIQHQSAAAVPPTVVGHDRNLELVKAPSKPHCTAAARTVRAALKGEHTTERPMTRVKATIQGPPHRPPSIGTSAPRSQADLAGRNRRSRTETQERALPALRNRGDADPKPARVATAPGSRSRPDNTDIAQVDLSRKRSAAIAELSEEDGSEIRTERLLPLKCTRRSGSTSVNTDAGSGRSPRKKRIINVGTARMGAATGNFAPKPSEPQRAAPVKPPNTLAEPQARTRASRGRLGNTAQTGLDAISSDRKVSESTGPLRRIQAAGRPTAAGRWRDPAQVNGGAEANATNEARSEGQDGPQRPYRPRGKR